MLRPDGGEPPFFTDADRDLVRVGGIRDPLGLQQVWSAVGRGLVPNLASPVTQVNGIKAVLLVYWLAESQLETFLAKRNFRKFFRLMEGIVEYHFWQPAGVSGHCFGARALSQGNAFALTCNDDRTVANGLFQYYSGSCKRAALLDGNWSLAPGIAKVLANCWSAAATRDLRNAIQQALDDERFRLRPAAVLNESAALREALKAVFASAPLVAILQNRLLGSPAHVQFAAHCARLQHRKDCLEAPGGWTKACVDQLTGKLAEDGDLAHALRFALRGVAMCEPWLTFLQDGFDLMRASPGMTLTGVAERIGSSNFPGAASHHAGARGFLGLPDTSNSGRTTAVSRLAACFIEDRLLFLRALCEHHTGLMRERNRDPLVVIEGDAIVVTVAADRSADEALEHMQHGQPWFNGYYLWTAATIHRQLFGATNE